jgi:hypothetical protein
MNLVKYNDNEYLNMDTIEFVGINDGEYYVLTNSGVSEKISEKAYKTILKYGKAEV